MVPFSRTSSAYLSMKSEDLFIRDFHSKNDSTQATAASGALIFFRESLAVDGNPVVPVLSSSSRSAPSSESAARTWSSMVQDHGRPSGAVSLPKGTRSRSKALSASSEYRTPFLQR